MRIALLYILSIITLLFAPLILKAQSQYYPDSNWEVKSPKSLNLNQVLLDSAISFAQNNENSVEKDLRIAILKAFAREPDFEI